MNSSANGEGHIPAGFWLRFIAYILDSIIFLLITIPFSYLLVLFGINVAAMPQQDPFSFSIRMVVHLILMFIFFGWFYKNKGATPGKLVVGVEVIHDKTGEHIGYIHTFLRELFGKFFSALPLLIGYIIVGFTKNKKGLHDYICNTRVVKRKN